MYDTAEYSNTRVKGMQGFDSNSLIIHTSRFLISKPYRLVDIISITRSAWVIIGGKMASCGDGIWEGGRLIWQSVRMPDNCVGFGQNRALMI